MVKRISRVYCGGGICPALPFLRTGKMYLEKEQKDKNFSKFYHEIVKNGLWARLSNPAIRVYGVLLTYAHYKTGWSYPTVKTISGLSGVNKNLVYKAIRELELTGLIRKNKTKKKFFFRNSYQIVPHPEIYPHLLPEKRKKRKSLLKGKDGRFTPAPSKMDNGCPLNMDNLIPSFVESDTCPLTMDKK